MNNHLQKAFRLITVAGIQIKDWFIELENYKKIIVFLALGILSYLPLYFSASKIKIEEIKEITREIELINVGEYSNISNPLSLVGVVESVSQASVRGESSGQLIRVYKKLGDKVFAGQVIAEFENSGESAGVVQAQGAYEQAKAARDISDISNTTSATSLETSKTNVINTINNAYITMDDIIRVKTDIAFNNPRFPTTRFIVVAPSDSLTFKIQKDRVDLEEMLKNREIKNAALNKNSDLENELELVSKDLSLVKRYLDDLANIYSIAIAVDEFPQAQIDSQKAIVGGSRSAINSILSSVAATRQALNAAKVSNEISGSNSNAKNPTQVSNEASIKIALGSYQAALSRLQKTIVRSPISGTINSISVKTGDYAVPSQEIAIISNNNALEVTSYISDEDIKNVAVGQEVILDGNIQGIVTRVASALDPNTRKVEVKIGIKEEKSKLTNGQSVRVEIKSLENKFKKNTKSNINKKIKIPLSSVKMTPRGAYVFSVNENKILKSIKVEMGAISGNELEILSGINPDNNILKDARGLKEGNLVEIKGQDKINN